MLDYVANNPKYNASYSNLLLGILRGVGKAEEFTALQLSASFSSNDQRVLRTMVTLNNRVKRYNVSLQILDKMEKSDWKENMKVTLNERLKKDDTFESTGMFPI